MDVSSAGVVSALQEVSDSSSDLSEQCDNIAQSASSTSDSQHHSCDCRRCPICSGFRYLISRYVQIQGVPQNCKIWPFYNLLCSFGEIFNFNYDEVSSRGVVYVAYHKQTSVIKILRTEIRIYGKTLNVKHMRPGSDEFNQIFRRCNSSDLPPCTSSSISRNLSRPSIPESQWSDHIASQAELSAFEQQSVSLCCSSDEYDVMAGSTVDSKSELSAQGADSGPVARRYSICVRQLPLRSSDSSIKEGLYFNFKRYGKVVAVKVIGSGEDRYGLVSFRREIDARAAVETCGQDRFFGRKIVVELARENMDGDDNERRPLEKDIDQYHPKSSRTLYVGNLWNGITPEVLKEQFSAYGTVLDIEIKNKETPAPFCFIQYADINSVVNAVLALEIDGYVGKNKVKVGFGKPLPTPTVWIDGLQPDITEAYLTRKMNFYGAIKDVLIDRMTGQALVTYDGVEAATNAVQDMKGRTIDNQRVRIDFCSRELHDLMVDRMYGTKQLDSSNSQIKPAKQMQQAIRDMHIELCSKMALPDEPNRNQCQEKRDSSVSSDDSKHSEQKVGIATTPTESDWNVLQSDAAAHHNIGEDSTQGSALKSVPSNFQSPPDMLKYSACDSAADVVPSAYPTTGNDVSTDFTVQASTQESHKRSSSSTPPIEITSPATLVMPELGPNNLNESWPTISDEQQAATEPSKLSVEQVEHGDSLAEVDSKSFEVQGKVKSSPVRREKSPELSVGVVEEENDASCHVSPSLEDLEKQASSSLVPTGPLWVVPGGFQRIPVILGELNTDPREAPVRQRRHQVGPLDLPLPDFVLVMKQKLELSLKLQEEQSESSYMAESEEESGSTETKCSLLQHLPVSHSGSNEAVAITEGQLDELKRAINFAGDAADKMIRDHIQYRRDVLSELNTELLRTGVRSPMSEEEPPEFMVHLAKDMDGDTPSVSMNEYCDEMDRFFTNVLDQTSSSLYGKVPPQSRCRSSGAHGEAAPSTNDWTAKIAELKNKFYTAQALSRVNDNWNKEMSSPVPLEEQMASVEGITGESLKQPMVAEHHRQPCQSPSTDDYTRDNEPVLSDMHNVSAEIVVPIRDRPLDNDDDKDNDDVVVPVPLTPSKAHTCKEDKKRSRRKKTVTVNESDSDLDRSDNSESKESLSQEQNEHGISIGDALNRLAVKQDQAITTEWCEQKAVCVRSPRKHFQRYFTHAPLPNEKKRRLDFTSDSDESETSVDSVDKRIKTDVLPDVTEPEMSLVSPNEQLEIPKSLSPCVIDTCSALPSESKDSASKDSLESTKSPASVDTVNIIESVTEEPSASLMLCTEGGDGEVLQITVENEETESTACLLQVDLTSTDTNEEKCSVMETVSSATVLDSTKNVATSEEMHPVTPSQVEPIVSSVATVCDSGTARAELPSAHAVFSEKQAIPTFPCSSVSENFAANDVRQSVLAQAAAQFPISFGDAGNVGASWNHPMTMSQLLPRPAMMDQQFPHSASMLNPAYNNQLPYSFVGIQQNPFGSALYPGDQTNQMRLMMPSFPSFAPAPRPTVTPTVPLPPICKVLTSMDDISFAELTRSMASLGPRSVQFYFERIANPIVVLLMTYLPYANQDSNCRLTIMEIETRHPLVWDGSLLLRRHELCVQLFHISGSVSAGPLGLANVAEVSNGKPLLRVSQRVVFNEETMKTMTMRNGTFLLCLIGGMSVSQMTSQWQIMREYLCNYLAEKSASGIIVNQEKEIAVTVSPPLPFVRTYIQQKASGIYDVLVRSDVPFLFIGVTKYT